MKLNLRVRRAVALIIAAVALAALLPAVASAAGPNSCLGGICHIESLRLEFGFVGENSLLTVTPCCGEPQVRVQLGKILYRGEVFAVAEKRNAPMLPNAVKVSLKTRKDGIDVIKVDVGTSRWNRFTGTKIRIPTARGEIVREIALPVEQRLAGYSDRLGALLRDAFSQPTSENAAKRAEARLLLLAAQSQTQAALEADIKRLAVSSWEFRG